MANVNEKQVGGSHYKTAIQPWDCVIDWDLGYLDGTALKYLARWKKKNGLEDIRKAIHFLEKLVAVEEEKGLLQAGIPGTPHWEIQEILDRWAAASELDKLRQENVS